LSAENPGSEYRDMPEPASALTVSWEDIVKEAEKSCIRLTRDQVIEIFRNVTCYAEENEVFMAGFWDLVGAEIYAVAD